MTNVLHVLDTGNWAGTESHVLTLATTQLQYNLGSPVIACPFGSPLQQRANEQGVKCVSLFPGSRVLNLFRNAILLRQASRKFDIVHAHNGRTLLMAIFSKCTLVSTQHFIQPASVNRTGFKGICSRIISKACAKYVDRWIAISSAVKREMLNRRDCREANIDLIYNGVGGSDFTCDKLAVRRSLGLSAGDVLVLSTCRLEKEKNVSLLVDIMELMPRHIRLFIAGEGKERAALEKRSMSLSNPPVFLGMRNDVNDLMATCDFLVHPAKEEPFGLVLIEAMSHAKPVVAFAAGGPLEIVDDRRTGFLVEPDSVRSFAGAVLDLAEKPQLRDEFGAGALQRFQALFTAKGMASATLETYQKALKRA